MKRTITLLLSLMCALCTMAQDIKSGVYMTYEDFQKGKLTEAGKCKEIGFKKAKFADRTFNVKDENIWGAVDQNGQLYRYTEKGPLAVLAVGDICMFSSDAKIVINNGKTMLSVEENPYIYFSHTGINGEVSGNMCTRAALKNNLNNEVLYNNIISGTKKSTPSASLFIDAYDGVTKWNAQQKKK